MSDTDTETDSGDLTKAERLGAVVTLVFAIGLAIVSADMLFRPRVRRTDQQADSA